MLNIMGALYSTAVFMSVANAMMVMPVINAERVVYYREKAAGMYSPRPYALALVWMGVRGREVWRGQRECPHQLRPYTLVQVWSGCGDGLLIRLRGRASPEVAISFH